MMTIVLVGSRQMQHVRMALRGLAWQSSSAYGKKHDNP